MVYGTFHPTAKSLSYVQLSAPENCTCSTSPYIIYIQNTIQESQHMINVKYYPGSHQITHRSYVLDIRSTSLTWINRAWAPESRHHINYAYLSPSGMIMNSKYSRENTTRQRQITHLLQTYLSENRDINLNNDTSDMTAPWGHGNRGHAADINNI